MYNSITNKFYWRTLYVDIGNFCRHCEKCTEVAVYRNNQAQESTEDQGEDDTQKITTLPTDRVIRVWKKVGLMLSITWLDYISRLCKKKIELFAVLSPVSHHIKFSIT